KTQLVISNRGVSPQNPEAEQGGEHHGSGPAKAAVPFVFHLDTQGFQERSRDLRADQHKRMIAGNSGGLLMTATIDFKTRLLTAEPLHARVQDELDLPFGYCLIKLPGIVFEEAAKLSAAIRQPHPVLLAQY